MTNFAWWGQEIHKATGNYMCCLCFEAFPLEELHMDEDGQREDVCIPCWEAEDKIMRERGLR